MAAVTSERYEMESVVRGHHIYKAVWTPVIREELLPSTSCSFWLHHSRILLASTVKCLAASLLRVLDCLSFKVTSYALRFDISHSVLTNTKKKYAEYTISAPRDEWASMGPGDNSNPGVYFLIGSGTPGVYMRSGVYLDPALKRSYTVIGLWGLEKQSVGQTRNILPEWECELFIPSYTTGNTEVLI